MREKTVKAYLDPITIIALIISGLSLIATISIAVYNDRYNVNADAAITLEASYSSSSSQVKTGTFKPSKGSMKYGWAQTKGNKNMCYSISYKSTSASKYTCLKNGATFSKNNKYYGEYSVCNVNGKTNYNFKIEKLNYKSTASKVKVDLMVL